jgi:hypothetical protein
MEHPDALNTEDMPHDEKGRPLDMPPEYREEGEDTPVFERAQLSQNLWHHYAIR